MTSAATASVAYLRTAEEMLCPVYGTVSLSTLETVIVQATRLHHPYQMGYDLEVEIKSIGLPAHETKLKILESATTRSADFFLAQFYDLGVQTEKDLAEKQVIAFYNGTRLIGLQRRY